MSNLERESSEAKAAAIAQQDALRAQAGQLPRLEAELARQQQIDQMNKQRERYYGEAKALIEQAAPRCAQVRQKLESGLRLIDEAILEAGRVQAPIWQAADLINLYARLGRQICEMTHDPDPLRGTAHSEGGALTAWQEIGAESRRLAVLPSLDAAQGEYIGEKVKQARVRVYRPGLGSKQF